MRMGERMSVEHMKQAVKRPVRRVLRRTGYELMSTQESPQQVVTALMRRAGVMNLVDVGANQGQYAEHMRATGYSGPIVSFEPGRKAYSRLRRAASEDPAWDCRQLALGAHQGQLTLRISANSVSSSLLSIGERHVAAAPASAVVAEETVRVSRLDEELPNLPGPAMLKIDTQGFELPVLQGSEKVLERIVLVQVELSLVELYEGQESYLDVLAHLDMKGFRPWAFLPGFSDPRNGRMLQVDVVALRADVE